MTTENTDSKVSDLEKKLTAALASIEKLEAKNSEILAEKKKAQEAADAAESEKEAAEEEKARSGNDLAALEAKLAAKHSRELAKLTKDNESANAQLSKLLIDNAINTAMDDHKVMPQFKKAVASMIKSEAKLDNGEAFAGNLPLADYIKDFVSSDDGKHFVSAPENTGAATTNVITGAQRGHGFNKDNFNSKLGEWMVLSKDNPELAKSIASEVGRTDLI